MKTLKELEPLFPGMLRKNGLDICNTNLMQSYRFNFRDII